MEEKYISLGELSEQLKEKEFAILEWYRKDLKVTKTKFFHQTSNATTLQELQEIKGNCLARKDKLETLIVQKEIHLGFRYKPYITQIEGTLKRYLEQLDKSIIYIDAKIETFRESNKTKAKVKELPSSISTFEDLFKAEYKDRINDFVDILKTDKINSKWEDDLERVLNDEGEWIGKRLDSVARVFWECLEVCGIIETTFSKRDKKNLILANKFKGIGKYLFNNKTSTSAELYRKPFIDEINKVKINTI